MQRCLLFLVLFCSSVCKAGQQGDSLNSPGTIASLRDTTTHNQLYLGINFTQTIAGDIEIQAMYRFKKRYSIMAGAGYDYNFLDFGNRIGLENQCTGCSLEEGGESRAYGRYFWGKGAAIRIILTDNFADNNFSHFFVSLYALVKYHDYKNYYFRESATIHCESANQQVFGMGFYAGYEFVKGKFLVRPYGGLGFRALHSQIARPQIYNGQEIAYPETRFTENSVYPAVDLGIIFLFRVTN